MRIETETRCQMLQGTVATIEKRQKEAERQQMATTAKLTEVLNHCQVLEENLIPEQGYRACAPQLDEGTCYLKFTRK